MGRRQKEFERYLDNLLLFYRSVSQGHNQKISTEWTLERSRYPYYVRSVARVSLQKLSIYSYGKVITQWIYTRVCGWGEWEVVRGSARWAIWLTYIRVSSFSTCQEPHSLRLHLLSLSLSVSRLFRAVQCILWYERETGWEACKLRQRTQKYGGYEKGGLQSSRERVEGWKATGQSVLSHANPQATFMNTYGQSTRCFSFSLTLTCSQCFSVKKARRRDEEGGEGKYARGCSLHQTRTMERKFLIIEKREK